MKVEIVYKPIVAESITISLTSEEEIRTFKHFLGCVNDFDQENCTHRKDVIQMRKELFQQLRTINWEL